VGDFEVADATGATEPAVYPLETLQGLEGSARCELRDPTACQVLAVSLDPQSGDFFSDFQPPSLLGLDPVPLHSARHLQGLSMVAASNRSLAATELSSGLGGQVIRNPVVCAGAGSAIVFQDLTAEHYPV
jgi:hypothetical protein